MNKREKIDFLKERLNNIKEIFNSLGKAHPITFNLAQNTLQNLYSDDTDSHQMINTVRDIVIEIETKLEIFFSNKQTTYSAPNSLTNEQPIATPDLINNDIETESEIYLEIEPEIYMLNGMTYAQFIAARNKFRQTGEVTDLDSHEQFMIVNSNDLFFSNNCGDVNNDTYGDFLIPQPDMSTIEETWDADFLGN